MSKTVIHALVILLIGYVVGIKFPAIGRKYLPTALQG